MQVATTAVGSFSATSSSWALRLMPCLTDIAFLLPAAILFSRMGGTKTLFADGDTGWHIRTGEWILQHGAVPTQDLFSYTKPHQPWFAWEWGWDLLFALIHRSFGLAGVGFVTVLLLGVIAVLLYKLVLKACGNDLLSFVITAFALCGSSIHWLARPHLFSWLFFLCFLHLLPALQSGSKFAFWALPLLMVFWVNMHGGFFLGIALLLGTACGQSLEALLVRGETLGNVYRQSRRLLVCAALCFGATFLNPYTWRLHQHVFAYLADAKLLDNIQEFQSISFHYPPAIFFELMLLLSVAAAFWFLQAGRITPALLSVVWIHLALLSARSIPLFLILVSPMVAQWLNAMLKRLQPLHFIGRVFKTIAEICDELKPLERAPRSYLLSGFATIVLAALFATGAKGFESQFDSDSFPVQAIPLVERSTAQRIFTYDQWADYLIYRLYPKKLVFMDGRSDFFGMPFVTATQHILSARYDWKTQLQKYGVDMILLKPDAPLCAVLKISPDWAMRFDDGKVLVFEAARLRPGKTTSSDPKPRAISEMTKVISTQPNDSVLERRAQHD